MNILIYAGVILVGIVVLGAVLTRLYRRSTKERGFVRTGLGGQRVVINGGALVLPVFHEVMDVALTTLKLTVERKQTSALLTKDRLRVDVGAEFYVRVKPDSDSVATAAQTLGRRTLDPASLKDLLEGKFVDALRSVASSLTMNEMHENRTDFVQKVQQTVAADLSTNGLELESVSLTSFDQTDIQYFNENNAFDAVGRAQVVEIVETNRKRTNQIQADNRVAIAETDRNARQKELEISREVEFAELDQSREIANRRAVQEAEVAAQAAAQRRASEEARISNEQATEQAEIAAKQETETKRIQRDQVIEIARQAQNIAVSEKSRDESRAKAEADEARAEAIKAEEGVVTARETARAEREKSIALVEASRQAEQDAIGITVQAKAERDAAEARAEAQRLEAQGFSDAEKLRAEGTRERLLAEAEGAERVNAAANSISAEQVSYQRDVALFAALPGIIEAAGRPIEKIEGIRIAEISGLGGGDGNGLIRTGGVGTTGATGLGDELTSAALRYQTASPLVQSLLSSVGIDGGSLGSMTLAATPAVVAPVTVPAAAPTADKPAAASEAPAPRARPRRQVEDATDGTTGD